VVRLNNIRVDKIGDKSRFADEVILEFLDGRVFFTDQFNGNDLAKVARSSLLSFINHPHAAFRDFAHHLVVELVEDMFNRRHSTGGKVGRR